MKNTQLKIKIISDIQNNVFKLRCRGDEDVLCIAGGISYNIDNIWSIVSAYSELNPTVYILFVCSPTDYYGKKLDKSMSRLHMHTEHHPRIWFLDNNGVVLKGFLFYGCTMWSDISSISRDDTTTHKDFIYIPNMDSFCTNTYKESINGIRNALEQGRPTIVITSFAPHVDSLHSSDIPHSNYLVSDETRQLMDSSNPPLLWIHGSGGHSTHQTLDYIYNNTRIVSNSAVGHNYVHAMTILIDSSMRLPRLKDNCSYGFHDLYKASYPLSQYSSQNSIQYSSKYFSNLPQIEVNENVKNMCKKCKWSWRDVKGDDDVVYTSFAPVIEYVSI